MRLRGTILLTLFLAATASAQIRTNPGFRAKSVPRNDDGSAPAEVLGWTLNFFGRLRNIVFVNNNGNITFDSPLSEFTPFGLTGVTREIIAPFFADVDTRPIGSALVTYGSDTVDGRKAFAANYLDVGYYNIHIDKLNRFQLVLIQREDTGTGNFDIEFNYERIAWETGDASGGTAGRGGVSASAGWSNGSGVAGTSYEIPGSLIPGSFLDSGSNSLVRGRTPGATGRSGRWGFRARGGTIVPNLTIATGCPAPNATAGRLYATRFEAFGSKAPYRWAANADPGSSLPSLSMNANGILSGTPTQLGTFEFTVQVTATDEDGDVSVTRRCSVTVDPPTITFLTNNRLPGTVVGSNYSARLRTDGAASTVRYELYNSTGIPGMTLGQDGVLSGSPTFPGNYQIQVRARSDNSVPAVKRFVLNVDSSDVSIAGTCPLPNGTGGVPYNYQFQARGGIAPYTWSVTQGRTPPGTSLSSDGKLLGTPTSPNWWPFSVTVRDNSNKSTTLGCGVVMLFPEIKVNAGSCPLPSGVAGANYSSKLQATGGTGPYSWSVSGTLPAGLRLDQDGSISGTPLASGANLFRVKVTDSRGQSAADACSLLVNRGNYDIGSCPLPGGYLGDIYQQEIHGVNGVEPYRYRATGTLPPGLKLSFDGHLTGVLTQTGTFPVSVEATDSNGRVTSRSCNITVQPQQLRVTNLCPLPSATLGQSYSQQLGAAGGTTPYTFSSLLGDLPPGLRLTTAGAISGTPTAIGNYRVILAVQDRTGQSQSATCGMLVGLPDLPDFKITGLPKTLAPAVAGPRVSLEISSAYPLPIEGEVELRVVADSPSPLAAVNRPDPTLRFSTGQQTAPFTFDPGTKSVSFQISNTGTVASNIEIAVTRISVNNSDTNRTLSAIAQIPRSAPVLTNVCYIPNTDGFDVEVTGYSTTRELTVGQLSFGANSYTVDLSNAAADYFSGDDSVRSGGTFRIRAPYRLTSGKAQDLGSGNAVIRNSAGASPSRSIARCN